MARKPKTLRCRVTTHLPGGAKPGDVVNVDPADPWIQPKIGRWLIPLEPYEPPVADAITFADELPEDISEQLIEPEGEASLGRDGEDALWEQQEPADTADPVQAALAADGA